MCLLSLSRVALGFFFYITIIFWIKNVFLHGYKLWIISGIDGEDICPYATFHLLGFREEMDPSKIPFQTFPHPNGHCGTIGPGGTIASNGLMHQCPGTQTMVN